VAYCWRLGCGRGIERVPVVAGAAVGGGGSAAERVPRRQLASSAVGWRSGVDVGVVPGDGEGVVPQLISKY